MASHDAKPAAAAAAAAAHAAAPSAPPAEHPGARDLISPLAPPSRCLLPLPFESSPQTSAHLFCSGPAPRSARRPHSAPLFLRLRLPPALRYAAHRVGYVCGCPFSGSMLLRSLIALGYPGSPSYPYPFPPPGATLAAGATHAPGAAAALGHLPAPGAPPAASVPAYLPAPPPIAPGGALTMRQLLRGSYTHHSCTLIHCHELMTNARSAGRRLSVPLPLLPVPLSALWLPAPAWRCVL